jgi:hemerythrin superfamily protein
MEDPEPRESKEATMTITSTSDILEQLDADHQRVKEQFGRLDASPLSERESLFCELVQMLVAHEVAEEVIVYPVIRRLSAQGEAEAEARITEQAEAEERLAAMEEMQPMSAEFGTALIALQSDVLAHAQAEERGAFPLLAQVEVEERAELGTKYSHAKASAPTHPHPHAPDTPPANKVFGPVTSLFDRARDAVKRS